MPSSKNSDTASNKASSTSAKQAGPIRTTTSLEVDSSRLVSASDTILTPVESATAAMIDVSSWAQRGLVLENKEIRRSLEMLKSGHAAQLAQINKRHKTEKEELEVKLQAEVYRQVAQQRTVDQLAAQVKHLQEENGKLVGNMEELAMELTNKAEQNAILQQDCEDLKKALVEVNKQNDHLEIQYEQLKSRDSRVTAMVNEQHDKIIRLSQAYNELEDHEKRSSETARMAEKEVERLKRRLSSILATLAKVVGENQDEQLLDTSARTEEKGGTEPPERRVNTKISKEPGLLPSAHNAKSSQRLTSVEGDATERHTSRDHPPSVTKQTDETMHTFQSAMALRRMPEFGLSPKSQTRSAIVRAKRRRIVSDPESAQRLGHATEIQVKREPERSRLTIASNDTIDQPLVEKTLDSGSAMEIEVLVPMNTDTAGTASLLEEGEDSPERAAVESAIGAQEEEGTMLGIVEDGMHKRHGSKRRPRRTYGKKRHAEDTDEPTPAHGETPTRSSLSTSAARRGVENVLLSTPQSEKFIGTTSTPHTPSYATRARITKPTKDGSQPGHSKGAHSSPSLIGRLHGKGNVDSVEEKSSPAVVKVKEEAADPAMDGRPRIVGGDDEDDPLCI
ncbi:hypothetical protein QFC19_005144 [Naganishia cerealis]|uniref:Uncharacterized protein n=1 Tax=Naganishia cerealis TaxID=610337 RepID=A0ACC2VQU7_9TREE|nr:hypothetical protein QFC19_005144 [Naganishia cerealis]